MIPDEAETVKYQPSRQKGGLVEKKNLLTT